MTGAQLVSRRQALGLSQIELWQAWGGETGIPRQQIRNMEAGRGLVPPICDLALTAMEAAQRSGD